MLYRSIVIFTVFKSDLEKDVMSDTSGHFKRLLVSQLSANRAENPNVDQAMATQDAKELFEVNVLFVILVTRLL